MEGEGVSLDWGDGTGRLHRPLTASVGTLLGLGAFVVDDEAGERLVRVERKKFWKPRLEIGSVDAWPIERTVFVGALLTFVHRDEDDDD